MEHEKKSMNVDEEELEEGKAKEGEPLAKQMGNVVAPPQRAPAGGGIASSNAPATFKSISDSKNGLSKGVTPAVGRTSSEAPRTAPTLSTEKSPGMTREKFPTYKGKELSPETSEQWNRPANVKSRAKHEAQGKKFWYPETTKKMGDEGSSPTYMEDVEHKYRVGKSIESTHGDQMKKGFPSGGTCGLCKRISKSITENVCEDCQSSMSSTQWHTSHLG
jgi:hypothetical protein